MEKPQNLMSVLWWMGGAYDTSVSGSEQAVACYYAPEKSQQRVAVLKPRDNVFLSNIHFEFQVSGQTENLPLRGRTHILDIYIDDVTKWATRHLRPLINPPISTPAPFFLEPFIPPPFLEKTQKQKEDFRGCDKSLADTISPYLVQQNSAIPITIAPPDFTESVVMFSQIIRCALIFNRAPSLEPEPLGPSLEPSPIGPSLEPRPLPSLEPFQSPARTRATVRICDIISLRFST